MLRLFLMGNVQCNGSLANPHPSILRTEANLCMYAVVSDTILRGYDGDIASDMLTGQQDMVLSK